MQTSPKRRALRGRDESRPSGDRPGKCALSRDDPRVVRLAFLLPLLLCLFPAILPARAGIEVTLNGPQTIGPIAPDAEGRFAFPRVPLRKNSVNEFTVTATDDAGNRQSATIAITQVSLEEVVVSRVTSERLSVQQVEQLVNEGVIKLDDPANYNVSQFSIVLTIAEEPVNINVPIVFPKEPFPEGYEVYKLPWGRDSGGGPPKPQEIEVVVFEELLGQIGDVVVPPIPGVIIIEGKIKSLKEFFSVRLLLMNASGIFTLSDVSAEIEFPDGGLTCMLPADRLATFGEILPGTPEQPGQIEKEFIVRGDELGRRRVKLNYGGRITGPGIPQTNAIPFNGSAGAELEVLGPPTFGVRVFHPDAVLAGEPYELLVEIQNTGKIPAMYSSFELDVGADAMLVDCTINTNTGLPECQEIEGPITRPLGHVMPGDKITQVYTVMPLRDGRISSCMGMSDQNITLEVFVGDIGCITGHYPPARGSPDGRPTLSVLPGANMEGVSVDSPVVAFFSEPMRTNTITTGERGSFNVFDGAGNRLPGQLRYAQVSGRDVAIWQVHDGVLNRLQPGKEYTVYLTDAILDADGNALFNPWVSTFRTTTMGLSDIDPPLLRLSVEPPVDPNYVIPGERVVVNAYAADQGSGIARIELRLRDLDGTNLLYTLVDQITVFSSNRPPYLFTLDSARMELGHTYQLLGTAFDRLGNSQNAAVSITMAASADPPTIALPASPALPWLQGVGVTLAPVALSGGVRRVSYFLDGATNAYKTVNLPPWQAGLSTLSLALTNHTIRAVAEDGLGQTGADTYEFLLVENLNLPAVSFGSAQDGARYLLNQPISITPQVDDPVGLRSLAVYLEGPVSRLLSTNTAPLVLNRVPLGDYRLYLLATNLLGIANDPADTNSYLEFSVVEPPPGPAPAAPTVESVSYPQDGQVSFAGVSVPGARVDVANTNRNFLLSVYAAGNGAFSGSIGAQSGDGLAFQAWDLAHSPSGSVRTLVTVQDPPVLVGLAAAPTNFTLSAAGAWRDLVLTGFFTNALGAWTSNLTARASYASDNLSVASVNAAGRVVAVGRGTATVTAQYGGLCAAARVFVDLVTLTNLLVTPSPVTLTAVGETVSLGVQGQYNDGSARDLAAECTFLSGDTDVVRVNASGLLTAVADGQTEITVYRRGSPPVAVPVSVNSGEDPPPAVEILSPAENALVERGDPVSVSVRATDVPLGVTRLSLAVTGATTYAASRQVSPPSKRLIAAFDFVVSPAAPLGGAATARAWAVDTSGHTSAAATVALRVADLTAPAVYLDAPATGAAFRYGDTVTVSVRAFDAGGLSRLQYYTAGALAFSAARDFTGGPTATNATFAFTVPSGVPSPEVFLYAVAQDAAGRRSTNGPLPIVISDADLTPPATRVTAVSDPGAGAAATLTYEVADGLDDLDHVAIYFRRAGFGTFNRYTDADRGNPLGRYTPASGRFGTVLFDSTKMGGDGAYEFYSVGVDTHGNREPAPAAADAHAAFAAGTAWTLITNATTIAAADPAYDNLNLRIRGATVTLDGAHAFHNVELLDGATLTHPPATASNEYGLSFSAWTLTVSSNSAVNVDGRGYLGARRGDNATDRGLTVSNAPGSTYRSAGSYGGVGGAIEGAPNPLYGSLVMPSDLGSGGSEGQYGYPGGNGGGRVRAQAVNIVMDGRVSAAGAPGGGYGAGSGSGGSIYFAVSTLSGTGLVSAAGGSGEVSGGGGRVAVHYVDISTLDSARLSALGGPAGWAGANGTVFLKSVAEGNGTLVVDGQGASMPWSALPIPPGYVFDNIVIRNGARAIVAQPLVVSNRLSIETGSIVTHPIEFTNGLQIVARRVEIDATSSMDVSAKGYRGGRRDGNPSPRGLTLGGLEGAAFLSGGSYGGLGGVRWGAGGSPVYGHPSQPLYLGSGGSEGHYSFAGGNGGGRIDIEAAEALVVNGSILAGGGGATGYGAGSGAGGSIWIRTSLLRGRGLIAADGGGGETCGGGGRVAVEYAFLGGEGDDLNGTRNITAAGGHGGVPGSAGTVWLKRAGQTHGDLYLDENLAGGTSSLWTPLPCLGFGTVRGLTADTLCTDGGVALFPNALIGLRINPNLNQARTFEVIANDSTSVTVRVEGGVRLTAVAAVGDPYAALYRFDNVYFRRGAFLALGDPPHPGFRPHLCAYDPLGLCDLLSSRPPPPVADDLPKDFARDQNDLKE